MQNERRSRDKLSAARKQNNIFQEAQCACFAAVLIVDVAVDVICVSQVNEFGARIKVAIIPSRKAKSSGCARRRVELFVQIEQHELAGIEFVKHVPQKMAGGAAQKQQLRVKA